MVVCSVTMQFLCRVSGVYNVKQATIQETKVLDREEVMGQLRVVVEWTCTRRNVCSVKHK